MEIVFSFLLLVNCHLRNTFDIHTYYKLLVTISSKHLLSMCRNLNRQTPVSLHRDFQYFFNIEKTVLVVQI